MSINIKEIFQSDNLSTSQDKINYNFDQILANGGGSQGLKGDKGSTGAIGSIGPKGSKGEVGGTGAKGSTGADGYWTLESYTSGIPLDDQHTLLPKIEPVSGAKGYKPTNLVLGVDDALYALDAIDKNALVSLVSGKGSADWDDLIRIRIRNNDGTFNATSAVVRLIPGTGGAKLKIATIDGNNSFELASNRIDLVGNDTSLIDGNGLTKLRITNSFNEAAGTWNFLTGSSINIAANGTAITLKNDGNSSLLGNNIFGATGKTNQITGTTNTITGTTNIITGTTRIEGAEFRINPTGASPALNKVLVAQDTNGKALWKNPTEVMGMYPVGTIVFVNPADIRDTYFSITNYEFPSLLENSDSSYQFFGRGKSGTRWGGWYLLMGQTNAWYLNSTLISYVPTNIPGSLLIGASAPDDVDLPGSNVFDDDFRSSMGTNGYNPPVGYGTSYQPTIRGGYTGVGSQGVVGSGSRLNPGDLLTRIEPGVLTSGAPYDYLDPTAIDEGGEAMLDANTYVYNSPTFNALPMAVYLGRTDLMYDYSAGGELPD
jgi:hypothetical protein